VPNFALCNLQLQFGMDSEHHQVLMSTKLNDTKEMLICFIFFGYNFFLRHQHLLEEKSQFVAFISFAKKNNPIVFYEFSRKTHNPKKNFKNLNLKK